MWLDDYWKNKTRPFYTDQHPVRDQLIESYDRYYPNNRVLEIVFNIAPFEEVDDSSFHVNRRPRPPLTQLPVYVLPSDPLRSPELIHPYFHCTFIDISNLSIKTLIQVFRSVDSACVTEIDGNCVTVAEIQTLFLGDLHGIERIKQLNTLALKLLHGKNAVCFVEGSFHTLEEVKQAQLSESHLPEISYQGWDVIHSENVLKFEEEFLFELGKLTQRMNYLIRRDKHYLFKNKNKSNESYAAIHQDLCKLIDSIDKKMINHIDSLLRHERKRARDLLKYPKPHPTDIFQSLVDLKFIINTMAEHKDWSSTDPRTLGIPLLTQPVINEGRKVAIFAGAKHLIFCRKMNEIISEWVKKTNLRYLSFSPSGILIQHLEKGNKLLDKMKSQSYNSTKLDFNINLLKVLSYEHLDIIVNQKLMQLASYLKIRK